MKLILNLLPLEIIRTVSYDVCQHPLNIINKTAEAPIQSEIVFLRKEKKKIDARLTEIIDDHVNIYIYIYIYIYIIIYILYHVPFNPYS